MKYYGLIGNPVDKSISHLTHNAYFKKIGLEATYVKTNITKEQLFLFIKHAIVNNFLGLSVTMPLKEAILPILENREEAEKIGAINTLKFVNGKIYGTNTDGSGALNAIEKITPLEGQKILVLGAGGAAKAIIFAACHAGAKVFVKNRDTHKAKDAAQKYGATAIEELNGLDYDILINCTPNPMPIEKGWLRNNKVVMDITTRHINTELLKLAQEMNCKIVYGYEMFIEQALGQFAYWGLSGTQEDKEYFRACVLKEMTH